MVAPTLVNGPRSPSPTVPRDCTTGVMRWFNKSSRRWVSCGLAASKLMVLARTTSMARTTSSSLISGPIPASAPRRNIASCRSSRNFLFFGDRGSPVKMNRSRPEPEPRLNQYTDTPSAAASNSRAWASAERCRASGVRAQPWRRGGPLARLARSSGPGRSARWSCPPDSGRWRDRARQPERHSRPRRTMLPLRHDLAQRRSTEKTRHWGT